MIEVLFTCNTFYISSVLSSMIILNLYNTVITQIYKIFPHSKTMLVCSFCYSQSSKESHCYINHYRWWVLLVLKFHINRILHFVLLCVWLLLNIASWYSFLLFSISAFFLFLSTIICKEIQPVHSKGDQSWVFIGRTDAKAEIPILWPPHAKSWFIGKDSDVRRDWG